MSSECPETVSLTNPFERRIARSSLVPLPARLLAHIARPPTGRCVDRYADRSFYPPRAHLYKTMGHAPRNPEQVLAHADLYVWFLVNRERVKIFVSPYEEI